MFDILSRHAPVVTEQRKLHHKYPEWFSPAVIRLLKTKRMALKRMRRTKSNENVANYKQILRMFKAAHREAYQVYLSEIQRDLKSNPKSFWNFVNSRRKNTGIPDNVKYRDVAATDTQSSTHLFAAHFKSVFQEHPSTSNTPRNDNNFETYQVSQVSVRNGIRQLDKNLSPGPDTLSNKLLKQFQEEFLVPLTCLFNASLAFGYFPALWKVSHITPIHKKGSRSMVENYRGITIQSAIPKFFEKLIYDQLYTTVAERISPAQH